MRGGEKNGRKVQQISARGAGTHKERLNRGKGGAVREQEERAPASHAASYAQRETQRLGLGRTSSRSRLRLDMGRRPDQPMSTPRWSSAQRPAPSANAAAAATAAAPSLLPRRLRRCREDVRVSASASNRDSEKNGSALFFNFIGTWLEQHGIC